MRPTLEPEIAVVMGKDLSGPNVTAVDAARAVPFAVVAQAGRLEVAGARIGRTDEIVERVGGGAAIELAARRGIDDQLGR